MVCQTAYRGTAPRGEVHLEWCDRCEKDVIAEHHSCFGSPKGCKDYEKKGTVFVVAITSEVDMENCRLPLAQTVSKCDKCKREFESTRRTAVFNTREEAQKWIDLDGEIDTTCFDVRIVEINVWEK